eukprot:SAG22_NODE_310_length_12645_cov_20.450183_2_plen_165_part_00
MAPGTGDWSIFRSGAVYLEGTEHVVVANCSFAEIGGNALFMMAYNRWNTVADSEFVWLGDSAVALVGVANGGLASVDGTDGNFPSDNLVTRNHMHETGVLTKQSSPFFQTVACHNNVTNNVMVRQRSSLVQSSDNVIKDGRSLCLSALRFQTHRGPCLLWPSSV